MSTGLSNIELLNEIISYSRRAGACDGMGNHSIGRAFDRKNEVYINALIKRLEELEQIKQRYEMLDGKR